MRFISGRQFSIPFKSFSSSASCRAPLRAHRSTLPNYQKLIDNLANVRKVLPNSKLTLAEKILYAHQLDTKNVPVRAETYLKLSPDRVAMQDASAQMALLQFMLARRPTSAVPASVHCDHLIEGYEGGDKDVDRAKVTNKEIFDFLQATTTKYGIDFWGPGSGIIHQIVLENYAVPGLLMLGTDSHTPNAGGLGMIAIGVGGADAVDAMAGIPWELKAPKVIGVHLTGQLREWASPKDVILKLVGQLTVRGGTNAIIEYFGPGVETLSCTGMATICNMGAEVGATTSIFPYTNNMARYLVSTNRALAASEADNAKAAGYLTSDKGAHYDQIIELNLSEVEPHLNGPMTPDAATPLSKFKELIESKGWKDEVKVSLIGSCTNSSYQDMQRSANIARQALDRGLKAKAKFYVTPGSEQIRATIERDGQMQTLSEAGAVVLANACGPCIGMWKRTDIDKNDENAIVSSFNRNFQARNDGFTKTMNFLASPELVTALAFSGKLSFNPITDSLIDSEGKPFKFSCPPAEDLPVDGFLTGRQIYQPPLETKAEPSQQISINKESDRLQLLEPFAPWNGKEFNNLRVLVKVVGKCTTDHISAAGPWLKYKGHLDNIANNTLIGALNEFTNTVNVVRNEITKKEDSIPAVARQYKAANIPWLVVGDYNYGEGSAREHAALQPRYLGCSVILTRSFARIHETNLKKQGVLPLTFANPDDYALIEDGVKVSTEGVVGISPGSIVKLKLEYADGSKAEILANHTMSEDQIMWFKAGSALNVIASQV